MPLGAQEAAPAASSKLTKSWESVYLMAVEHYNKGEIDKAAGLFTAIAKDVPTNDAAHYYLALCHVSKNNIEEAELHLLKAVELDSSNFWYRQRLAALYAATERTDQAIEMYESMIKDFPKRTDLYYSLVDLYTSSNKFDEALDVLDKIDTIAGKSESTAMVRFQILGHTGHQPEAYAYLESFNEEYSSPQVLAVLGDYQLSLFNDSTALALYDESLALAPGYAPAMLGKAETYRMTRRYQEFFDSMTEFVSEKEIAVEGKAEYLNMLIQRSDLKFANKYRDQLEELLALLVETHPDSQVAAQQDCLLSYAYSDYAEISEKAERYLTKFPEDEAFLELALFSAYNLKNYERVLSIASYQLALAKEAGDKDEIVSAYSTLGDAYHEVGDAKKAYKNYDAALKLNPDYVPVLNNYAYYLSLEKKKLKKAYAMSKKTVEAEENNATYLDTFGWILHLQKKDVEALAIFKRAMLYGGKDSAVILRHYAEVLEANGKDDLADMYRRQAAAKDKE